MNTILNNENDLRFLSERELIFNIYNKEVTLDNKIPFEEFIRNLTPGKKQFAQSLIELYKRYLDNEKKVEKISCPDDCYNLLKNKLVGIEKEECWVVYLNNASKPIKIQRLAVGGLTMCPVDVRLIARDAILCCATSIILVHNHPSGNLKPSLQDDKLTEQVQKGLNFLNIKLLEHLIIGGNGGFYSYEDNGKL